MKIIISFLCLSATVATALPNPTSTVSQVPKFGNLSETSPFDNTRGIFPNIVGGVPATPHAFPYQVSLQVRPCWNCNWRHFCGGSIVAPDKVVTAAHCLVGKDPGSIRVIAGEHCLFKTELTEQNVTVLAAISHPDFNYNTGDYDYAVLRLASPLRLNEYVETISLASSGSEPSGNCTNTGWGNSNATHPVFPDVLHVVTLPIVPRPICAVNYENSPFKITERMVCAGDVGKGSCHGDSGGPLACNNTLTGIVSWGKNPCGQSNSPTVFANIAAMRSWLDGQ
ncbi:unnamed protein product [Allacma fusca]|uniref:Peptidase S1 domain-containing protein n=1 Tax=Allacma fusca TaxID=39272 RepID=A0A8J2KPF2_9HEXA|nr:unnamed protein product [Allacma fusca]